MLIAKLKKKLPHFGIDVQFSIGNEIVVLFGPSGSGKTTILNMLAGLTHPDDGHIQLQDVTFFETGKKPLPVQKRNIGYVFQDYALFPHMTVEKNIYYGVKKKENTNHQKAIHSLMDELGIRHLLQKYPNQISGGEKQRVALARALSLEPQLLLLDEPFAALDQKTKIQGHEQLLTLQKKWRIPVLLVTHNWEEAEKLGNRILLIESGHIKESTKN